MPTLDQLDPTESPVHLLLVAPSKYGKSVYAAQAAIDGFTVIYIDSDNGRSALDYALAKFPEAKKRVHYLGVTRPQRFLTAFLRSNALKPLIWNTRTQQVSVKLNPLEQPEDKLWIIDLSKVPSSWVISQDSWSALAFDTLEIGSADQKADLLDRESANSQGIYGTANAQVTFISNVIQKDPRHWIVQAHGTTYEKYEKPLNQTAGTMKQKDMVLREMIEVPLSSSRPHGETLGTRFNHIGWLDMDGMGNVEIDFTRKRGRVGGGPPNKKAKITDLSFKALVGGVPAPESGEGWFKEITRAEHYGLA